MAVPSFFYFNMISRISSKETEVNLAFCVIQKFLQQTPQVSTVQENIDPAPVEGSALLTAHSVPRRCVAQRNDCNDP